MGKPKTESAVFAPPGLQEATALRADAIARLECLRIVTQWKPQWDTETVLKAAADLEKFVSGA